VAAAESTAAMTGMAAGARFTSNTRFQTRQSVAKSRATG